MVPATPVSQARRLRPGKEKGLVHGPQYEWWRQDLNSGSLFPENLGPGHCFSILAHTSLGFQIGHRDFDVEKRLRRDLRRTHALLSDVQLLLGTMEDGKTSVSKEELEKVQSQVGVMGLSELGGEGTAASRGTVWMLPRCGHGHSPDL